MTGFGFSDRQKLKKTDDFSSVFNFRRRISGNFLVWHYQPNTLGSPRLGLVIGKKTARRAVARNYIRRVLRELFRYQQHQFAGVDLVIRVQKSFGRAERNTIDAEFLQLMKKLPASLLIQRKASDDAPADIAD